MEAELEGAESALVQEENKGSGDMMLLLCTLFVNQLKMSHLAFIESSQYLDELL